MGNSNCGTGSGQVYDYWVLGHLGLKGCITDAASGLRR